MANLILVDTIDRGIAAVTLNRPERRNALSIDLLEQLCLAVDRLASDRANRVVILRGAGPVFSAGLDLHEAAEGTLVERSAALVSRALSALQTCPLIFIAAVQGGAIAGGAGLMAACDIAIATDDAKFGFPEVRRGLLPALICDVLRRKVREGDLRELFLAGETISAVRAQQVGLVQRVVPASRLLDEAYNLAQSVAAGGPETIRQTKALLNAANQMAGDASSPSSIEAHLAARNSDEGREGLAAFAEKRSPNWSRHEHHA
jgi:methylglutaconyl-CoA hydratase